jgi:hypothetical protein
VVLSFASSPSGLQLAVGSTTGTTPFSRTVIVNSLNSISALTPQVVGSTTYDFARWSDGLAATHSVTATSTPATYTATYTARIAALTLPAETFALAAAADRPDTQSDGRGRGPIPGNWPLGPRSVIAFEWPAPTDSRRSRIRRGSGTGR